MNQRILWLGGAIGVVLVGLFLMRGTDQGATAPKAEPGSAVVTEFIPAIDEKVVHGIPWKKQKLKVEGGFAVLPLLLQTKALGCGKGDLDALKGDLKASADRKLIFTVERPLAGDTTYGPVVLDVDTKLKHGTKLKLLLPLPKSAIQLGLFLCTDSSGTRRCNDKRTDDINTILGNQAEAEQRKEEYLPPERNYFFQYVMLEPDGSISVFANSPVAKQAFEDLEALTPTLFPASVDEEKKQLGRAKELQTTFSSLALMYDAQGTAAITLPGSDNKDCRIAVAPNGQVSIQGTE